MRVAIVGSRTFKSPQLVEEYIEWLPEGTELVSGGASGVDKLAEIYGKRRGLYVTVFPADWNRYGKSAGYRRNEQIVDYADCVAAFWDGESRGTAHTISVCEESEPPKPLLIVFDDGTYDVRVPEPAEPLLMYFAKDELPF